MPMLHHTQYTPVEGKHILEAALCGTCHTVITEPKPGMEFIEQAPFLEWRASSYPAQGRTCQKCHLPDLRKPEYIAHRRPGGPFPPTRPRSPFGLHSFLGANVQGLRMLGQNQAAEQTSTFLPTALTLAASIRRAGEHIEVAVLVSNNTGHKLPTGFPSRRLWLHFRATAAEGAIVFESGAPDRVTEGQPHLQVITSAEQAIVYESEYEDLNGRPTVSLVRAARYRKDNRILPRGFAEERGPDVLPVGIRGDADFGPGSDMVVYRFRTEKPCRVTVDALYQSIRPSHAQGLTEFREKYRPYSGPVIIARAEAAE